MRIGDPAATPVVSLAPSTTKGSEMPSLEEFCTIRGSLSRRILGKMPGGMRIDFPFEATATSPHWEGERPVRGVDYVTVRADGNMDLDIRGSIGEKRETIAYRATGVSIAHEDNTASPQELIVFETGNEEFEWLNRAVGVGLGKAGGDLELTIYVVRP
jgi:hypothetical protein